LLLSVMRFTSQKIRRNNTISRFRALEMKVWLFAIVLQLQVRSSTALCQNIHVYAKKLKFAHFAKLAVVAIAIVSLPLTSIAESSVSAARKMQTLNVIPGKVHSRTWKNEYNALIQDVGKDALYQEFSRTNAAYIFGEQSIQDVGPVEGVLIDSSEDAQADTSDETSTSETTSVVEDVQSDVSDSSVEEAHESVDTVSPEITPTEALQSDNLQSLHYDVSGFARTTARLPFVQESLVEQVSESIELENEIVPVSDVVASHEELEHQHDHVDTEVIPLASDLHEEVPNNDALKDTFVESYSTELTVTSETLDEVSSTEVIDEIESVREDEEEPRNAITFSDFSLPRLDSGQFIQQTQLRLSLAGAIHDVGNDPYPTIEVEYTFNGSKWQSAGTIMLDDEISNAINRGYYLLSFPHATDPDAFEKLEVRVTYVGSTKVLNDLYIDAVWLELHTETFDRDILKERLSSAYLSQVKLPSMHELISDDLDFARNEKPVFVLRYESQRNIVMRFLHSLFSDRLAEVDSVRLIREDAGPADVSPSVNMTDEGLLTINLSPQDLEKLQPGTYSVELTVAEGSKEYIDTFNFQWGMLAINPHKTEYEIGDTARISLGALSSSGNTVCDANLQLYIVDPNEYISHVPVYASGLCNGNNVIDRPDYLAETVVDVPGTYEMYVEHLDQDGKVLSHTSDVFAVVPSHELSIERNGPTRIYPPALYPMDITVTSRDAFKGTLVERVPKNFIVHDTDAVIREEGDELLLSWNLDLAASSSVTVSYRFDAPDISPYLYTLGPADVTSDDENIVIVEEVPEGEEELLTETITDQNEIFVNEEVEQVTHTTEADIGTHEAQDIAESADTIFSESENETHASTESLPVTDAVESNPNADEEQSIGVEDDTTDTSESIPVTDEPSFIESVIDSLFGEDINIEVPVDAKPAPAEADQLSAHESANLQGDEEPSFFESVIETLFGEDAPPSEDVVIEAATTTDELANPALPPVGTHGFRELRKWQIASDATGSMLLYWASTTIPSGWTCVSCGVADSFYQRFVMGSSTAGSNGGASSHTHTATGVVSSAGTSTSINSGGGGASNVPTVAHAHTYSPTISTDSNLPQYRELVLIQYNSAGSPPTIPANAIAVFDASVPTGWDRYTPQDGYYIRSLSTTTIGTTGGANTHSHSITGSLLATSNFITSIAGDTLVDTAQANHTHTISTFTDTVNHEPPYREAILGKLSATSSPTDAMIAMWTDTPPTGWGTVSSTSEPFANRFIKPSATYGTAGGSATTTHANTTGITSSGPTGGTFDRDLVTVDNTVTTHTHTHSVDVTNYTVATTLPPYRTAIFAKRSPGGASPDSPTIHTLFDYEQTGTSTPQFEFTGSDPDGTDNLVYQFQWDDDENVETSPIGDRTSSNETGCSPNCFINTASSSDVSPFVDGDRIQFTIQSALTTGTTYYWRVRVQESVGATWSSWSTVRSFTYTTGVDPSKWHQTEGSQFDAGILVRIATTSTSTRMSTTTTSVPVVQSGWNVATASPGTTLTLAKPANVEVGDLLLIIVGNDDNTDTDQWDNSTLKPSGFTLINEAGDITNSDAHSAAFYRVADGTESATTSVPAQTSADYWGYYIRVTGASTTNPINVTGADYLGASAASHAITSITTTVSNTLAFYVLSADGADTYPFSVSGTGWSESAETFAGLTGTEAAGTWGTRSMTTAGATGAATVALTIADSASGFQFAINPAQPNSTIVSSEVDFDTLGGQTDWGEVTWNVTEPLNTDTRLRFYYASSTGTTSCELLVPDAAIPGNSVGFDAESTGILIHTLATSTYNRLCLKMKLDLGTGTSSPTLNDWTVSWTITNQEPDRPRLAETPAFDSYRATTTTPILGGFSTTDFDSDTVEYELTLDDDPLFGSPNLTKTSSNYPTDAGWSATTFASNATTTYTIQSADALTNGATYYWRIRARDPLGSNEWSSYSVTRSITISTIITVPEWYETSDTQFISSSTLSNATTTGGGGVEIDDLSSTISLLSAWSLGTTKATTSGTNRMLIVVIASEDAATDNINTVSYGGQTLTEIYDQTVGVGASNSLWVGYLNDAGISAAANTTITPTWTPGSPAAGDVIYSSAIFDNVDQTSPIRGTSANALTSGTTITPTASTTVYAGDMVLYGVTTGANVSYTPHSGYTEGVDNNTCTGGCSATVAYKAITSDRTELPTATLSGSGNRVAMTLVALKQASATGYIMSSPIDFDWVSAQNDWGEIRWSVTEPVGSDTLFQLYYATDTTCTTIVPNGVLSGNAAGFTATASPLNIASLSTTTYNKICVRMTLSEGTGTTSPTLDDWNVSWEPQAVLSQSIYHWYVNTTSSTPTDVWPLGTTSVQLGENDPITATDPVKTNEVLRLRIGVSVSAVAAANLAFKLQYSPGNTCLNWSDVGAIGSTTALWRGYDNSGLSDGATLASSTLDGADTLQSYEEANNSAIMPNTISVSGRGEWDWVLQNRAEPGTEYCFRMVTSDGTPLNSYTEYPLLITNEVSSMSDLEAPFDNEKVASTSPWFDFSATDPEADSIDYQIQIDNDNDFSSTVVDTDSASNLDDFLNFDLPSDKSPFDDGASIRYIIPISLTNGTTYWWRVRPIDTDGSANYGDWSTAQSFTIDTSVTVSTWYQTTEEQFDTDTLFGTDATGSDLVTLISGSTTGTTTGTTIDFDDVTVGNAWGTLSWTDNETTGDIKYHIQYYNGTSWALVPDSALSGNLAGYDTSPIDLIDLDTETYNQIRVIADFVNSGGAPTLSDWTVTWGQRVSVPTHLLLFDNEKTGTTTPTFTFYGTDPESDPLEYEFSWSTDNTFVGASSTAFSSSSAGFSDLTDAGDTHPFDSGDTIQYVIQSPLTNGTTYWWRLRAFDGDSYSFWSEPWSFTVDTTATTSTWFQTTQEQFDTDTLLGLIATTTDTVTTIPAGVTTYDFTGITNPSATHIARYFEVDVADPTDPPTFLEIDSLTNSGTVAGTPNINSGIAGYAGNIEASNAQYTAIATSDNSRWTTTDPGAGDNAVFWTRFKINEDPDDIDQIDILFEGYQAGVPGADKGWLGIWRPGSTTPYWFHASSSTQTSDRNYTYSITSDIDEYFDGSNNLHIMYFNEDDSDSNVIDYIRVQITTGTADSGVVTGSSLDFDDGNAPAWGQMRWTDSEPGFSSISYQLEYLVSGDTWSLIPDGALAGNSSGFTTAPVSLGGLDTSTYNEIRPVGNFNCVLSSCPSLSDWTITWSPGFTISGTAFEYDGVSSTTSGTVNVAVNGTLQTGKTGSIAGDGTWSIPNVSFFENDIVTVFVNDGAATATNEAVAITQYDGTPDITGMRLQKRHITIGSDDYADIANSELELYDFSDNENMFFDVDGDSDVTLCADVGCDDASIRILPNNSYTPGTGADVVTHDFVNYGTFTAGANTFRVSGSWRDHATSTLTSSAVIFTATSSTESITTPASASTGFNTLTLGETSGTATWNASTTLDINGNLFVTYGTLNRGTTSLTIAGNLTTGANGYWVGMGTTTFDGTNPSTWTDQNSVRQNIGRVLVDGTAKTLLLGSSTTVQSLTIGADDTFDTSVTGHAISVFENWINNNTFTARTSRVTFLATTTNRIITVGGDPFYDLTFTGVGGSWSFTESTLTVNNDLRIATGTVTLPTATTTITGSFSSVGGTFAHNNAAILFNSASSETIAASGSPFTNEFYNVTFTGSGSWTFLDTSATTSNNLVITQGSVTFPSNTLTINGTLTQSGGSFTHNSGIIKFTSSGARTIDINSSSFNTILFAGTGTWSFADASVTVLDDVLTQNGTTTFPSGTLTIGGSLINTATITPNGGTVLFNSSDTGEVVSLASSSLSNMVFNSGTGGWTITGHATATNNVTLTALSSWVLSSGQTLSVGGTFTNSVGGASTTWTGSTLSLEAGNYSINTKSNAGDTYAELRIKASTTVSVWNSTSTIYTVDPTGSLYSQDHFSQDGDLYIFGTYRRVTGSEYWSYATDFDGTTLSAMTSRQVDVRFASGSRAVITGSLFDISGTSTASTSISNQGSGSYVVYNQAGTTTFQHYVFEELGPTGVSLLGTTTISSLRYGAYRPATVGGTGLTISSTTIDANPALQIYNVEFATTTTIAASSVSQLNGTPASYWWFRGLNGNISGEAFDNDTGDPGSIRWDNSSLVVTISGTVYADGGVTPLGAPLCDGATPLVRVVVQGGSSYTGSCASGDGSYSIPGVTIVGDPIIAIYLDSNGGAKGAVITKTVTADIADMNIYRDRVMTRHEDVLPLTIADMAVFDTAYDSDLRFEAATGTSDTLTVFSGNELRVSTNTTFAPNGDVTIQGNASSSIADGSLYIDNDAILTGNATSTYSVAGNFTLDEDATFTIASTTVLMNATTTGKAITTGLSTQTIDFNALSFTGVGGGWNINGDIRIDQNMTVSTGTVTGTGDITVVHSSLAGNGTLSMGSGTTTLERTNTLGGTTPWTFANLVLGNSSVNGTTTPYGATTTILGKLTVSTGHILSAGGTVWDFEGTGTVFAENGTFAEATSTIRYRGVGATNVLSTSYYNLELKALGGSPVYTGTGLGIVVTNNLTVGGSLTTTFTLDTNDVALDVNGSVLVDAVGTLVGSNSGSFTVAGNWDNNGTFTASGGTVTFDSVSTSNIAAGNSPFGSIAIQGSGTFTISESATATSAFTLANAGGFTVSPSVTLAVGGQFSNAISGALTTWTGSTLSLYGSGTYTINASTTNDVYNILSVSSGTQIRMWNSSASTYAIHTQGSLYSQDHANVTGDLYIYGAYTKSSGTDYWNYATDFDGTLLTGSERAVDVFIQGGGSVLYTGGGLAVIGAGAGSTTIQNQGSGTYSFRIGGNASTTWSYYEVSDTDGSGVVLSGTPTVVSLSNGSFEVGQNSGSALTVGGSVITQNPAKTFTNNSFSTSTGVSPAFNVTATGTTISSWRFTNHTGSIDGELYNIDPDGDPGYIVWDDSAANITISGTVYSGEGSGVSSACDDVTTNIHVRVAGLTSYTGPCSSGDGTYAIPGVLYSPGDSFVVYIDGESEKAATVSEDPVSNVTGLDLYENRVIVRHESSDSLSIADMAAWDSSDDGDIPFTAVDGGSDTLTLPSDRKLIVWTGKEFEPNGDVTVSGGGSGGSYDGTLELYANATFDATGSETHTVGGSLIMGSSATLDDETSTFIFTTTGSNRTIDTNDQSFYNLVLQGSGSWSVSDTNLLVLNDLTVTSGIITLPNATTTIGGSLSVAQGSFLTPTSSVMSFIGAGSETLSASTSKIGTLQLNGTGSLRVLGSHATITKDLIIQDGNFTSATGTLTLGGSFTNNDTFTHGSGVLKFIGTTTVTVTPRASDMYTTLFAGNGSYTFTDTNVSLLGSLMIASGSVQLATGTMSIGGSFTATGTFNNASGTILFNSTDTGELINPGTSPFNVVTFGSASGGWTITGNATATAHVTLSSASSFTLASSTSLFVGGVFTNLVGGGATTWTGSSLIIHSGTGYTVNTKVLGGDTYNVLYIGSSTALRSWDSAGTVIIEDANSSLYSQDHAGVSGGLNIYGNYVRGTGTDYWSYATDFDGSALSGPSARQVYVSIANGATTTMYDTATLAIVGVNGFDTTITNQGTGSYALQVLGGTLNAQYYSLTNMNISGLYISGTTSITSLSEGNFILTESGGSLMTLAASTLNYNAGLTLTSTSFSTTSAITGYNITLVGSTPSAWTLSGHTGNLSGEAYDVDGGDACGSIRWDDSTCLLTEQTAYRFRSDDGGEGVPNTEWFDLDWAKRKRVVLSNENASSYTNAVIKIEVTHDSDMQVDFDDLRFTDDSGVNPLDYFIESYTASTDAIVWVEVPLLATSTETEVYMYYGNGAVSDTSATTTFAFIDTFEDGNISEYAGDTGEFTVGNTGAYERTYVLNASDPTNGKTDFGGMYNNSVTVSQGEKLRFFNYIDTTAGSADEMCTLFGTQNQTQNYAVCLELFGVDRMSLARNVLHRDTSGTVLGSTTVTYTTGWYEVEIEWNVDDTIDVSLIKDGTLVATTSATDSNYTSGGVGYTLWGYHGGLDIYSSRPLIPVEPTVTFGFEQVSGGASWLAALNTIPSGLVPGDPFRLRFLIENTGLTITDQNFEIEYAAKGVSPSCESVNLASYVEVPDEASCGTNDICMETSTHITNLASTTDLLGGTGTFTQGQIVEDPSNNTGNITVDASEYTELEYVLLINALADETNYCLRVSNEGTDLDSYAKVAELALVFEPSVSAVTLNAGRDITLTGGTTTVVSATGTVSDQNGYADMVGATTTIYRSGVGDACAVDPNNCYRAGNAQCTFTSCSGNSCDVSCSIDVYYHADPTDIGTFAAETWRATLEVQDTSSGIATGSAPSIDLITLRSISVDNDIDYGPLSVNSDTGSYNPSTTIQNIGNDTIDLLIEGTDLSNGVSSVIPVSEQIFATSTFTYSSCVYCNALATTSTTYEVDLTKPTTTAHSIVDQLYWGIEIPFGVAGTAHYGVNTFYATGD
jgi:hypothetical protein